MSNGPKLLWVSRAARRAVPKFDDPLEKDRDPLSIGSCSFDLLYPPAWSPKRAEKETGDPMQYLLLIYENEQISAKMSKAEGDKFMQEYFTFTNDIKDKSAPSPPASRRRVMA
jgi:hypothetical protein